MIAVDKPWGVPSTGRQLDDPDSLQFALMQRCGEMVWAVQQLDADTSGVNIFVRTKTLVPEWQQRMRYPNGVKTYLAIVHGRIGFDERRIEAPIGVLREEPSRQLGVTTDGQRAVTQVHVLDRTKDAGLLRVRIETGRTHQIRIHLASIGHPLFGEDWYREPRCREHPRQALHALRVEFGDAGLTQSIESPWPDDLRALTERLRLKAPTEPST
jgi:23S rRNA-/tRNA-specific pseudouridylate synthase